MDVTPLVKKGYQIIQSYAGGVFKISGQSYFGPVIVFAETTNDWNTPKTFENLVFESFSPLINLKGEIDVVLLGCGHQMKFIPAPLKMAIKEAGLHIEVMDTGAACRTYNVLMADGRRVAAALLPA